MMVLFAFIQGDYNPESNRKKPLEIDETLFKRIGNDDMVAFDELYYLTERTMYAFALSLTKDHHEALDLMQDVYLKIIVAAHLYQPMGKPLAWMFTITKNLFYKNRKKQKRSISMESEIIENDMRFSYINNVDDKIVLVSVLKILSEEEREIVLLYAVSGMKHKEIAEQLGLKLSTTLSKYHRALKKLRNHLEAEGVRP